MTRARIKCVMKGNTKGAEQSNCKTHDRGGNGETLERGAAPAANVDGVIGRLRQELVALGAPHHPYRLMRRSRARALVPLHAQCRRRARISTRSQQQPPPEPSASDPTGGRIRAMRKKTPGPRGQEGQSKEAARCWVPRTAVGEKPRGVSRRGKRNATKKGKRGGRGRRRERGDRDRARGRRRALSLLLPLYYPYPARGPVGFAFCLCRSLSLFLSCEREGGEKGRLVLMVAEVMAGGAADAE
jgi:hypothetical protein